MGFSPFFLLYGQPPFLPVDLLFPPKKEPETSDRQTYAEKWTKRMPSAFEIAQKTVKNLQPKARDIMTEQSGVTCFSQVSTGEKPDRGMQAWQAAGLLGAGSALCCGEK